jgi:hypothetical protein
MRIICSGRAWLKSVENLAVNIKEYYRLSQMERKEKFVNSHILFCDYKKVFFFLFE